MQADSQEETLRYLAALDGPSEIAETHISRVILGRSRAFKLKRAVVFPYLDFSTPQKRLEMCEREAALNQRLAPRLYLGARRITRSSSGELELDGPGELVDAMVEMRRFDSAASFSRMAAAGALSRDLIERLARRLAAFHDKAEIVARSGGAQAMAGVLGLAEASLRETPPAPRPAVDAHLARLGALLERFSPLLDARHSQGKTRLCHGDLTLANICVFEGEPTPFDCLEFSDELASVDVLYDLAFLLMDLWRVGLPLLANLALNRYLDRRDETDGLPLLPLFCSLRATIRAYVAAEQNRPAEAGDYFRLAQSLAGDGSPRLVAIGGYSGSGKSSAAAELAPSIGAAPGARTINSDRLRKSLFGAEPAQRLPPEAYASEVSARVYKMMMEQAASVTKAGWPAVVDAVFDRPDSRQEIEQVAQDAGAPFDGFWLEADLGARIARVGARQGDPSDATQEVLEAQMHKDSGDIGWRRVDAERDLGAVVEELGRLVSS
ncbi:AAA family ATPase [Methylocystis heyeri]|uniref:AAA family ATPase n=1 Tax=Methylocystis heyeri TaxID=391905 RepID=A0A6B8KAM4_9HYPH|nr:AAA family ATPase [Methylocystis heyeri]QGM44522.1 AAA family ATPase [Methylocystis heyeri]